MGDAVQKLSNRVGQIQRQESHGGREVNFTKEVPTRPGFYAWRQSAELSEVKLLEIFDEADAKAGLYPHWGEPRRLDRAGGEWCRLVPAEEIGQSHSEGWYDYERDKHGTWQAAFDASRAKRVMEGEE